ncbi:hypothetical protein D3C79_686750 [compost metagenome]
MPEQEHAITAGIQVAIAVHVVQIDAFGTHLDGQVHHRGQAGITRIDMVTVLRAHALGIKPFGQGGEAVHRSGLHGQFATALARCRNLQHALHGRKLGRQACQGKRQLLAR